MSLLKVAVLDDYQGLSEPIFSNLDQQAFVVTVFRDTLQPYNHAKTTDSEKDELVRRLLPFDIICTMRERTPFPATLIERLPNLKFLLTTGNRNAALDLRAFEDRAIPVVGTGNPSYLTPKLLASPGSTTQHCVAMNLALARNIAADDAAVKTGGWQTTFATDVASRVFGTVGLGRLGKSVAKIMHIAFGVQVIAWSSNLTQDKADDAARSMGLPVEDENGEKTFKAVSKEELFKTADIVNIHLVLSDRSRGLITIKDLEMMKPTALFVNTSRGPIVVEEDLLDALNRGVISGAALDVFDVEPLPKSSPWRTTSWGQEGRSQVLLTPHMGYVEKSCMEDWYQQHLANIKRWKEGKELADKMKSS